MQFAIGVRNKEFITIINITEVPLLLNAMQLYKNIYRCLLEAIIEIIVEINNHSKPYTRNVIL